MGNRRLVFLASLVGLFYALLPGRAEAQICDRAGYTREANCPNEARDATGCCPAPRVVTPRAPRAALPPAEEACPLTQVRTASGRCCWPGQRGTASGCAGRPRSCPLGWEPNASGCLPAGTRSRSMVLVPPPTEGSAAFVIDRTPVTVQAYRQCVEAGTCAWREPEHLCNGASHRTHPMNCVSREAAGVYCAWAGLRLPTAAEWERAAGAADGRRYPWGDELPDDRRAHWGQVCARPPCTAPVGRRPTGASPYGAQEMAGNVWEWTAEGHARGGDWTGSELEMRVDAARRGEVGAHLGFRCAGDLDWNYAEVLGESDPPVAESRLTAPFRELARARGHLARGEASAAAERFEAAIAALEARGHSRAFVFRYHAAAARDGAREPEAAVAHLVAYFEEGGTDPPSFDAPRLGSILRRSGLERALSEWERDQPRWAQRPALRESLGAPAAGRQHFEAELWDWLAVLEGVLRQRRPVEAETAYLALERRWRDADLTRAWVARAHLAAALEQVGERERAAIHYAVFLAAGGDRPPPAVAEVLSETVVEEAEGLRERWQARFGEGRRALEEGYPAAARRAFEEGTASVDGHPSQARALVWTGRAYEREGDLRRARMRLLEAIARAPSDARVARVTRARLWGMDQRFGAGDAHSCLLRPGGRVTCWGADVGVGDGGVSRLEDVTRLAVGGAHTCAVGRRGEVACWGDNRFGQLGRRFQRPAASSNGSVDEADRRAWATPTSVSALSNVVGLVAGVEHTCALHHDGRVSCWGGNSQAQLGDWLLDSTHLARRVSGLAEVSALAAGARHTCALRHDGTVACWGHQDGAPLTAIPGLRDVVALTAGWRHTCALVSDGHVRCWGELWDAQEPRHTWSNRPTPIVGLANVVALATGPIASHTCALRADGRVFCWGSNEHGQLGVAERADRAQWSTPELVPGITDAIALATGDRHTCAELGDGGVQCWGDDGAGQFGGGSAWPSPPVSVLPSGDP